VQKDINHPEEELAKGNDNPGIGRKYIGNGIIEHRGKKGGRLYVRKSDSVIEISRFDDSLQPEKMEPVEQLETEEKEKI